MFDDGLVDLSFYIWFNVLCNVNGVGVIGEFRDKDGGLVRYVSSILIGLSVIGCFKFLMDEEEVVFVFSMDDEDDV